MARRTRDVTRFPPPFYRVGCSLINSYSKIKLFVKGCVNSACQQWLHTGSASANLGRLALAGRVHVKYSQAPSYIRQVARYDIFADNSILKVLLGQINHPSLRPWASADRLNAIDANHQQSYYSQAIYKHPLNKRKHQTKVETFLWGMIHHSLGSSRFSALAST